MFASAEDLNRFGKGYQPEHLGLEVVNCDRERLVGRMPVRRDVMAPTDFLAAASVIALADVLAGYATLLNLPAGAQSFTTIELKTNFLGTAREGTVRCEATPAHRGRTTQVWDAKVTHEESGKTLALFRCTQLILWPSEEGTRADHARSRARTPATLTAGPRGGPEGTDR